ncbi:MAG: beta-galactosidase [Acidobacteriaceae bacterium]
MKLSSRRRFIQQLGLVSSAIGASPMQLFAIPGMPGRFALLQAADKPQFKRPEIIRYDAQCFTIKGRDVFIYSACFHYPRTPKALWRDRILKLKMAGFNTIETYVFWNYHEPVEGQVDMTELEDFIQLVREMGLWMIVRVGPYVCAEWDAGGFPHWIIEKQFPLRSDQPESVKTSQDWYNKVLPIVRKNMITVDGPVVMIQIENEYDDWKLPNQQKLAYITALARMVWNAGIDIPITTNWVRQARENSDPVMAQIMDTCDFYPRWDILKGVVPRLAKLRKEEPSSPVSIAELQGGWFSQFGGKLSVDQDGIDAAQLNMLTKTVMEHGTTYLSFYMGHGGTNFDWAARSLTTTYDYAAPIREPGGLWEKYYSARKIGAFLDKFGPLIVRAQEAEGSANSTNPNVSVNLRVNGKSGFLFVRENVNAMQQFHMKFLDPTSSPQRTITVPRQGSLSIGPRGMKVLAVQVPIPGGHLRYSTAEILSHGANGDRPYIVIYDDPGQLVEIALATPKTPHLEGDATYQFYDADGGTIVIGFQMGSALKMFLLNGTLQIVALPRELAGKTWTTDFSAAVTPQTSATNISDSPVITDSALMTASTAAKKRATLVLEYSSGEHELTTLVPIAPDQCTVDGVPVPVEYDAHWRSARLHISTPPNPFHPIVLSEGKFWVDTFEPSRGKWLHTAPVALEKLGRIPYGYVKYRATFNYRDEKELFLETFTEDNKQVFLNGKSIHALSKPAKSTVFPLTGAAKPGANLLEISYEAFGSANGGLEMQELKGIQSIRIGHRQRSTPLDALQIQRFPAAMKWHGIDPDYTSGPWLQGRLGGSADEHELMPAFTWFRTTFPLVSSPEWFSPLKVTIDADRDALIYVNGKFIGYFRTIGPQRDFYLPEPYLHFTGDQQNVMTVVLAYAGDLKPLRKLVIAPYTEFATRKTRVEFHWKS